jgi:hypothetical protein
MSGTVFDLLADLLTTPELTPSHALSAKAANPAKTTQPQGPEGHLGTREGSRTAANPDSDSADTAPDSQPFAAIRNPEDSSQSTQNHGSSQDSQDSQGTPSKAQPLCAAAAELGADARELLGCLLWLFPDAGALPERALALATGWPLGVVLGAGKALELAGLATKSHAGLQPSRRLLHELSKEGQTP